MLLPMRGGVNDNFPGLERMCKKFAYQKLTWRFERIAHHSVLGGDMRHCLSAGISINRRRLFCPTPTPCFDHIPTSAMR
jgi:hypothetical protein